MITADPPPCRGSGAEFEAVNPTLTYDDVSCSCGRRFNVRIVRTRRRVALIPPIVIVPRHRATQESS
jgi:hypothetical protein